MNDQNSGLFLMVLFLAATLFLFGGLFVGNLSKVSPLNPYIDEKVQYNKGPVQYKDGVILYRAKQKRTWNNKPEVKNVQKKSKKSRGFPVAFF